MTFKMMSTLSPLPLAKIPQALEITLQLSPGLYGAPRTLAIARSAQNLAAAAGIFFPTSHYLVSMLELLHPRGSGNETAHSSSDGVPPSEGKMANAETGSGKVVKGTKGHKRHKQACGGKGTVPERMKCAKSIIVGIMACTDCLINFAYSFCCGGPRSNCTVATSVYYIPLLPLILLSCPDMFEI